MSDDYCECELRGDCLRWLGALRSVRPAVLDNGERAPHKPLLLLYAFGRWRKHGTSQVRYVEAESFVSRLIDAYAPPARSRHRAELPFYHLASDGVWTLSPTQGFLEPKRAVLRREGAVGRLADGLERALQRDPRFLEAAVDVVLGEFLPQVNAERLRAAVGV